MLRKRATHSIPGKGFRFYICCLSTDTVIYKVGQGRHQIGHDFGVIYLFYALEIPDDAYTTLGQNLIGCPTLSQECCKLIILYWKRQLLELVELEKACSIHFPIIILVFIQRNVNAYL